MVTIKDVAREVGVSVMTVSAVLNNKTGEVSAATRERVLEASRRLNYRPSAVARRLAGKRINTIGIADRVAEATYWSSPYESPVFEGILLAARRHRWDILYFAGHPAEEFSTSLSAYLDGRCDGMVYFSHEMSAARAKEVASLGLPVVLIGDNNYGPDISVVDVDNISASHDAVSFLIGIGHRRIGMLQGSSSVGNAQRVQGYRRALTEAGIDIDESLIYPTIAWEPSGYRQTMEILAMPDEVRPTAVFCFNDSLAFGALRAARDRGVPVPEGLSIVGFDDVAPAATSNPPLTTVRQPLRRIGERAVDILLGIIRNELTPGCLEILPTELVVRGTTAPLKK